METTLNATLENIRGLVLADVNKFREDAEKRAALAVSLKMDALTEQYKTLCHELKAAQCTIEALERNALTAEAVGVHQRLFSTMSLHQSNVQRLMRRIFASWVLFRRTMRRRRMALSTLSVSSSLQLARRAYWMWRASSCIHARRREVSSQRRGALAHTRQLEESATVERNTLKSQILALTHRLDIEVSSRDRYREELRAALLRGVCALNQEALDIFADPAVPQSDPPKVQRPSVAVTHRPLEVPRATKGVVMNPDYPPKHS